MNTFIRTTLTSLLLCCIALGGAVEKGKFNIFEDAKEMQHQKKLEMIEKEKALEVQENVKMNKETEEGNLLQEKNDFYNEKHAQEMIDELGTQDKELINKIKNSDFSYIYEGVSFEEKDDVDRDPGCPADNSPYLSSDLGEDCSGSFSTGCNWGGEYHTAAVHAGNTYTFSTCGGSFDSQLTLYGDADGDGYMEELAYSDDACGSQSEIVWESTLTGTVYVMIDEYYCSSNNTCTSFTASCTIPCDGVVDCAGVCNGDAVEDCLGDCNGSAVVDDCGVCGGSGPSNGYSCADGVQTCEGNDIDVDLYVASYGSEKRWTLIGDDVSYGCPNGYCYSSGSGWNYHEFCLQDGAYVLDTWDGFGDGWDGAYIMVYDADGSVVVDGSGSAPEGSDHVTYNIAFGYEPVYGCTDETACNYNELADTDDGSCVAPNACGSCEGDESCLGCLDAGACNYDADATIDDGTCTYPSNGFDCDGVCSAGTYTVAVGGGSYLSETSWQIVGVTAEYNGYSDGAVSVCLVEADDHTVHMWDSFGDSWNGNALTITNSDGSVIFSNDGPPSGCEGSCTFVGDCDGADEDNPNGIRCYAEAVFSTMPALYGCTDTNACNYDENADTDDGSCTYAEECYDCDGGWVGGDSWACDPTNIATELGSTDGTGTLYDDGGPDANYSNSTFYVYELNNDDGDDATYDGLAVVTFSALNMETNYDKLYMCDTYDPATGSCDGIYYTGDFTSQLPLSYVSSTSGVTVIQTSDSSVGREGFALTWEYNYDIPGCTDPLADNYNPDATFDDGSCLYPAPAAPVLSGQGGFTADGDPMMQLTHDAVQFADYYTYYYYNENLACESASEAVLGSNSAAGGDEWFSYTTTVDGANLIISSCTAGESVDTRLFVYDSCDTPNYSQYDDDSPCSDGSSLSSEISMANVAVGTTVKIFWDDYWSSSPFTFTISEVVPDDGGEDSDSCYDNCDTNNSNQSCCTHDDCGDGNYCYTYGDPNNGGSTYCYSDATHWSGNGCDYYNDSIDTNCDGYSDCTDCPQGCTLVAVGGEDGSRNLDPDEKEMEYFIAKQQSTGSISSDFIVEMVDENDIDRGWWVELGSYYYYGDDDDGDGYPDSDYFGIINVGYLRTMTWKATSTGSGGTSADSESIDVTSPDLEAPTNLNATDPQGDGTVTLAWDYGDYEAPPFPDCDIPYQHYLGDGYCDYYGDYNTENCGWDGGDCCEGTCTDGTYTCGSYNQNDSDGDGLWDHCCDPAEGGNCDPPEPCAGMDNVLVTPYLDDENGCYDNFTNALSVTYDEGCTVTVIEYGQDPNNMATVNGSYAGGFILSGLEPSSTWFFELHTAEYHSPIVSGTCSDYDCAGDAPEPSESCYENCDVNNGNQACCAHEDCGEGYYCYTYGDPDAGDSTYCWNDAGNACDSYDDSIDTNCDGETDCLDCPQGCADASACLESYCYHLIVNHGADCEFIEENSDYDCTACYDEGYCPDGGDSIGDAGELSKVKLVDVLSSEITIELPDGIALKYGNDIVKQSTIELRDATGFNIYDENGYVTTVYSVGATIEDADGGCWYVTAEDADVVNGPYESAPSNTDCVEVDDSCPSAGTADANGDGDLNVLDVVIIVGDILDGRTSDASSATIYQSDNGVTIESDGFVAGIEMFISHDADFAIELTDDAMVADYVTNDNITHLIVVAPEGKEIFTSTGDFIIDEVIAANTSGEYINVDNGMPTEFSLSSAYPNPFNPVTNMKLSMVNTDMVSMNVYNVSGQLVDVLVDGTLDAGYHNITWDASNVSSGVYFVKVIAGTNVSVQKLMLLK